MRKEYKTDDIIAFLIDLSGTDRVKPDSDINDEIGMYGDDFDEMIEKFGEKFSVDISDYLWYFHSEEEGFISLGGIFFKPPNQRVNRIPITPAMLTEFANLGCWNISYPPHKLPKYRIDIIINTAVTVLFVLFFIIGLVVKYLK